jgi:hypothetical protein
LQQHPLIFEQLALLFGHAIKKVNQDTISREQPLLLNNRCFVQSIGHQLWAVETEARDCEFLSRASAPPLVRGRK